MHGQIDADHQINGEKGHGKRARAIIAQVGQAGCRRQKGNPVEPGMIVSKGGEPGQQPSTMDLMKGKRNVSEEAITCGQDHERGNHQPGRHKSKTKQHYRFTIKASRLARMASSFGWSFNMRSYSRMASGK